MAEGVKQRPEPRYNRSAIWAEIDLGGIQSWGLGQQEILPVVVWEGPSEPGLHRYFVEVPAS